MSALSERHHATRTAITEPQSPSEPLSPTPAPPKAKAARTKSGTAWLSICVAAFVSVLLVVFLLQNLESVNVSFLWMSGEVPLALALLIAGIGVAIVASTVGAVRVGQLRHQLRARRH